MTRYYFDMREGDEVAPDEEGMEVSSLGAVQAEAAHALSNMARDMMRNAGDVSEHTLSIDVRDDAGPVLRAVVTFTLDRHRKN